ncbi:MAG: hypothetical protein B6D41_18760 [Chloroflexi bacterium UTCFX4]|nr:MAG: hypothetical protein B6D41_18760 [Chloroflexi bacterium UTCFX4]
MIFSRRLRVILVLPLIILGACDSAPVAPTAPPPPTTLAAPTRQVVRWPTAASGWNQFTRSTYQIALPASWQEIKLQPDALRDALARAQENNPPLADALETLLASGQYQGFIFYAADDNAAPLATTLALARAPLPPNQTIETLAQTYSEALPNLIRGAQVTRAPSTLKINNMDVAAFEYTLALVDTRGKLVTLRGQQYLYILDSGDAYLVTITGDAADTALPAQARAIAETFAANP